MEGGGWWSVVTASPCSWLACSTSAPVRWHNLSIHEEAKLAFSPVWPRSFAKDRAGRALCLPYHIYRYLFFTVMFKRMYKQFTFSLEIQWWDHSWLFKKLPTNHLYIFALIHTDLEVNLYDAKSKTAFQTSARLQLQGLEGPSGWFASQASKLLGAAQRYPVSYTLHFILTPFVSFQLKKIKHVFLVR